MKPSKNPSRNLLTLTNELVEKVRKKDSAVVETYVPNNTFRFYAKLFSNWLDKLAIPFIPLEVAVGLVRESDNAGYSWVRECYAVRVRGTNRVITMERLARGYYDTPSLPLYFLENEGDIQNAIQSNCNRRYSPFRLMHSKN